MVNKRQHYSAVLTALHMVRRHSVHETVVHIMDKHFFSGLNTAISRGFRSSVHRGLNNNEPLLFGEFCFNDVYSCRSRVLQDLD